MTDDELKAFKQAAVATVAGLIIAVVVLYVFKLL